MADSMKAREVRLALDRSTTDEERAKILAELTDLSPNQADGLLEKFGRDNQRIAYEACLFKAEG